MARLSPRAFALALTLAVGTSVLVQPVEAGERPAEELARLRSSDAELERRLEGLEEWLAGGQDRLELLDEQLEEAELSIEDGQVRVDQATREVAAQAVEVQERAVAAYVHPSRTAAPLLSGDANEAAQQSLLVRQVAAYDREVLGSEQDAEQRLARAQAQAEAARDELAATEDGVTDLLDSLFAQKAEAETAQVALDARIEAVQAEVDAMAAAQSSVADLINDRSQGDAARVGPFLIPVDGTLTSRFGPRFGRLHAGIDIAAPTGSPILAAAPGRTIYSGWMSGYGNVVIVDHGGGVSTLYAHQSRRRTVVGDTLGRGEILGEVGSTGNSTGPHVHFEIRLSGVATDPIPYLSR
jgi:murein DD-endopeptidase MepM/ murein hydrolase activator NlpD